MPLIMRQLRQTEMGDVQYFPVGNSVCGGRFRCRNTPERDEGAEVANVYRVKKIFKGQESHNGFLRQ
jgi:hypothetical protein